VPLESIICRRKLDEERGNPFICGCPLCKQDRGEGSLEIPVVCLNPYAMMDRVNHPA